MMNPRRVLAALIASAAVLSCAASCSKKNKNSAPDVSEPESTAAAESSVPAADPGDTEITWLADYDLNDPGYERPAALAIFEDVYGGRINYVQTTPDNKLSKLAEMINAGEEVDMFPYEDGVFPEGVCRDLFQPLDPYYEQLGMEEGIWDEMSEVIDMFAYKGEHYVVPYALSEPFLLTYSRKLMQSEGIDDPYTLYQEGKWNWNTFMDMINKFSASETGVHHFGINGFYGEAMLSSTGSTVIGFDGSSLKNNIGDPKIESAEAFMQDIRSRWLYNSNWSDMFLRDQNTLFYASRDWSLPISDRYSPDLDIMVVPFPKMPDADKNYINCRANARMLVKTSAKGKAVATYLKCERLAVTELKDSAKERALKEITEEQYNAIQEFLDPSKVTPVFDLGYGMSEKMYGNGLYTFETRGVMNNITSALLEGGAPVGSWSELRDRMSPMIDEELAKYNDQQ
ncbi:MAG: extracellular solute-binding protein [Ruminococcus sp.]|nr:extracellular solute-binding protein [Ruminococcus sp.]